MAEKKSKKKERPKVVKYKLKIDDIGGPLFTSGVTMAIVIGLGTGFFPQIRIFIPILYTLLAMFGFLIGILNITNKESNSFLLATIALLLTVSSVNILGKVVDETAAVFGLATGFEIALSSFLSAILVFVAPATAVVSLRTIYNLSKD